MAESFYLIDGHSQIFRAYHARVPDFTSPGGEPTKATFVFVQMLLGLIREKRPDYLAVAMDVPAETTHRREAYPEYKATRDATPEDLVPQIHRIVEIVRTCGIPIFQAEGYEADDVMATIAERLAGRGIDLYLVSRDKDLHQVIRDGVVLWDPMKNEVIDRARLEAEKGYSPEMAIEIQALMGDSSDNVPGVPGVGPKKAVELVRRYGSAEAVIEHAGELTPKLRENILAFRDLLPLSKRLVTLERDLDFPFDPEACRRKELPSGKLARIFDDLGFARLRSLLGDAPAPTGEERPEQARIALSETPPGRYTLVDTPEGFRSFLERLGAEPRFAFDTETTSVRPVDADLVGIAFSWKEGEAWYLPVRSKRGPALDPKETLERLRPVLADPKVGKCGHNLKYDIVVLRQAGIEVGGVEFDSMVASYLLNPDRRSHSLDQVALEVLHHRGIPISDLIGRGKDQITMDEVDTRRVADYSGEDVDLSLRLRDALGPQLADAGLDGLFREVEMPLVEVLAEMEANGVALERGLLEDLSVRMKQRLEALTGEIHRSAGHPFNIDSPKQLAEVLFDELGLRVVKRTKTGRSTDAEVLQALAAESLHPLPRLLVEYREIAKLRSTYVDPLPGLISPRTGRVHPSFHQAVAATGRLSSSDPNIQNIPIRTEQGREIRKAFVAGGPGDVLLTADYSQVELRVLAHLSGDQDLVRAFHEDRDIHAVVASEIYRKPIGEVTKAERARAKAVNFGIIYGQTAYGLARSLRISQGDAAAFIRAYKARYPGIARFVDRCVEEAERDGFVQTILGRRRPIPEIRSRSAARRSEGARLAINTVVQGSAADLIKVAMVRIFKRIQAESLPVRILVQIHDELVFEVPRDEVRRCGEVIREEMSRAIPLSVPLRIDIAWGDNWLEGKEG